MSTVEAVDSEEEEMRLHVVADEEAATVCEACAGTVYRWCDDRNRDGNHGGSGRRSMEVSQCSWAVWGVVGPRKGTLRY